MFQVLKNSWRVTEIRKKILYTIMIIAIFRIGSIIPVPFIDIAALKAGMQSVVSGEGIGSFLSYINILTGGGLEYGAIFAMSVTPYINASIIMQLLSVAIPALERISKEGEEGRKKIAKDLLRLSSVLFRELHTSFTCMQADMLIADTT